MKVGEKFATIQDGLGTVTHVLGDYSVVEFPAKTRAVIIRELAGGVIEIKPAEILEKLCGQDPKKD